MGKDQPPHFQQHQKFQLSSVSFPLILSSSNLRTPSTFSTSEQLLTSFLFNTQLLASNNPSIILIKSFWQASIALNTFDTPASGKLRLYTLLYNISTHTPNPTASTSSQQCPQPVLNESPVPHLALFPMELLRFLLQSLAPFVEAALVVPCPLLNHSWATSQRSRASNLEPMAPKANPRMRST